ncbi:DUF1800 domain-containing protein [Sodalis sp. dw_96]|uniref:DUF1800 domain-containing protein n=1 Tax=Sodalis sp. dw_96 TaxID=2719794 RepID=UPI001BD3D5EB|nr:DUF1800 domain-containing protein [Sodalis sp. dw_96]
MTAIPEAAIALNRFGLGARPDEDPPDNARRYLLDQFEIYQPLTEPWDPLPASAGVLAADMLTQRDLRGQDPLVRSDALREQRAEQRDIYLQAVQIRAQSALLTPTPFIERLVHFWANHFALSVEKGAVIGLAGGFEAEAIRPHVLGRFEDLLMAVEQHPAMLLYLDQTTSIGPDSPAALRADRKGDKTGNKNPRGLNENFARETMELHTLGARTGYTQNDVTEFARALTGWGVAGPEQNPPRPVRAGDQPPPNAVPGAFRFFPALHQPGVRTVLGRQYAGQGEDQGLAILRDYAASPATARHIATKLARHFSQDTPAKALVDRLTETFIHQRGSLPALYRALVDAPETWAMPANKFKTPWEWLISGYRALGLRDVQDVNFSQLMTQLGQPVWRPGSPAGWDDIAAGWAAPDALVRRVELAQRMAFHAGNTSDPRVLARQILPGVLSETSATAISRAESPVSGLALLLVSPDFLRR